MSSKPFTVVLTALLLAGCATIDPVSGSADAGFGEAVKYNSAAQTVNPDPRYGPEDALPGENGQRGSEATKRYRSGQVKETEGMGTTEDSGGPK